MDKITSSMTIPISAYSPDLREPRAQALRALLQPDVDLKNAWTKDIQNLDELVSQAQYVPQGNLPGRPQRPVLVSPRDVALRGLHTREGRAALLHAIAHIEFNAINLALDIIWRFTDMPSQFYGDWLRVAQEEVTHFCLLREHLQSHGYDYGDFPAHNGLWEMAVRTEGDLLGRLAMVPRTLEARGLDVSPGIRDRLAQAGDHRGAEILQRILDDEITHVRFGNDWYHWVCRQRGLSPQQAGQQLERKYAAPRPRGPINLKARRAAGFDEVELARLLKNRD